MISSSLNRLRFMFWSPHAARTNFKLDWVRGATSHFLKKYEQNSRIRFPILCHFSSSRAARAPDGAALAPGRFAPSALRAGDGFADDGPHRQPCKGTPIVPRLPKIVLTERTIDGSPPRHVGLSPCCGVGSSTVAADALGISRTMASKHVTDLEPHLGVRLLNRTTRRLSLTEAGAAYAERCQQILAAIDEADGEATKQSLTPHGRLRLNAPLPFGIEHVAPLITSYFAQFPDVTLDLTLNDRIVDLVDQGYDLAIRIRRLLDSLLVARRLASTRLLVCGAPAYFRKYGRRQVLRTKKPSCGITGEGLTSFAKCIRASGLGRSSEAGPGRTVTKDERTFGARCATERIRLCSADRFHGKSHDKSGFHCVTRYARGVL
jgi:hypothetical protein